LTGKGAWVMSRVWRCGEIDIMRTGGIKKKGCKLERENDKRTQRDRFCINVL